ncbi:MAG: hypothetical protein K2N85_11420 [Lachnospiraceae bacterium]|nr:hypothetical protein [Lachnospiraceae bacterium]
MGMRVGTNNADVIRRTLTKPDGTVSGTITISKPKKSSTRRKKRLNYNYKKVSNQILQSKTTESAQRTVGKARRMVATLKRKLRSSEYDDGELKNAIIHAEKMVRIAKKRKKHIEEEERAEKTGVYTDDVVQEEKETSDSEKADKEREAEENEKKLREMEQKLAELMEETVEETMEETMRESLNELADGLLGAAHTNMDPEDIERLKKQHRSDELREIIEADMKYLKALFEQLAKEKQAAMNGSGSTNVTADAGNSDAVSLELGGVEMPVQTTEAPIQVEGACVDISV